MERGKRPAAACDCQGEEGEDGERKGRGKFNCLEGNFSLEAERERERERKGRHMQDIFLELTPTVYLIHKQMKKVTLKKTYMISSHHMALETLEGIPKEKEKKHKGLTANNFGRVGTERE